MSVPKSARRLAWAAAWLVVCARVAAQSSTATPTAAETAALDPVLVTATGYAQPLADAIAHSTVLTRDDILRSQAPDLPSLLAREAGVQLARSGGRGAATTLFLRGAPASQVLLLVDGVPQTRQDATGSLGIEHLMLDQVERVEVVRGNVSAIYGSGAVGGVIQVFTQRGGSAPGADATVEGGSYGYGRVGANASGAFGATRVSVGIAGQRSSGFSAQDPLANPAVNPDADGYRNTTGSASITHEWTSGHTIAASVTQTDGRLDYDSAFATAADVQQSRTKTTTARLTSSNQWTSDWQSQLAYGWQRDDNRFDETGPFGYSNQFVSGNQLVTWNNRYTVNADWKVNAGLEWQRQSIDANDGFGGVYAQVRNVGAAFAGAQGQIGAHSVQANLRYDDVGGVGSETTGYLGYALQFAPQWKATASASNAFNAPTLGYLYAPYFGNPALKPENATSFELGLQYASDTQLLRATLFSSRTSNQFQYDFATNRIENIAKADNHGLELSYSGRLAQTELGASLTLQDPTDADTGQRLVRRARTLASASVWQPIGAGRVGVQWTYVGSRTDIGDVMLAAYSLIDVLAQCDVGHGVQIFGRIENVFDKQYQAVDGYNQPGLAAYVGLRWKFQ